jgi:flagellar biosynthesis protein FlhF
MAIENGNQTKVYEGRTLEEILPRIREELGPDAVITRQREGVRGGIAGFFQRHFIEVEARPGAPRVDVYDEGGVAEPGDGPVDPATAEGLSTPAIQQIREQAAPFADYLSASQEQLGEAEGDFEEDYADEVANGAARPPAGRFARPAEQAARHPAVAARPEPLARPSRPQDAESIERRLVGAGLSPRLASAIVDETVTHLLPFGLPRDLKDMVRKEIARRIPVQSTWSGIGRRVAFVGSGGSGKTTCTARLAAAYAAADDLPVVCMTLRPRDGGAQLEELLEGTGVKVHAVRTAREVAERIEAHAEESLVVLDTPSVSPSAGEDVAALAEELREAGIYEVHMTLPATVSSPAARGIANGLSALGVTRVVITHADETDHVGGVLELAIRSSRPLSYVSRGATLPGGLAPADPLALAAQVIP